MQETTSVKPNGHDQSPAPIPESQRIRANRANAQHSTGPRTPEGKQRSSLNALRHGLTGHVMVLPGEDLLAYKAFTQGFHDEYQPKTHTEQTLTQSIADISWKLNRITALENNLLVLGMTEQAQNVNTEHPQVHDALAMAKAYRDQSRMFATLAMHENRLLRERERVIKQLQELQATRRREEEHNLLRASRLLKMHKSQGIPYNPAEDGFVFSIDEIETYARREKRYGKAYNQNWPTDDD